MITDMLRVVTYWLVRHPKAIVALELTACGWSWTVVGATAPTAVLGALAGLSALLGLARTKEALRRECAPRANRKGDIVGGVNFAAEDELIDINGLRD